MGWFGPSGDCGCCGSTETCPSCLDDYTELIITGLGTSALGPCASDCDARNGTYLFRASPWNNSVPCTSVLLASGYPQSCGAQTPPNDQYSIIASGCGMSGQFEIAVEFLYDSGLGLYSVEVEIRFQYSASLNWDGSDYDNYRQTYFGRWSKTSATCDGLAGELSLIFSLNSDCNALPGDTGDVCNLLTATIEIA